MLRVKETRVIGQAKDNLEAMVSVRVSYVGAGYKRVCVMYVSL